MNLNDFAKEVHQNAVDHGWWDEERTFGEIVALCHSELSEALEEYRAGRPMVYGDDLWGETRVVEPPDIMALGVKPEGIAVELADCVIRILDWFGKVEADVDQAMREGEELHQYTPFSSKASAGTFIAGLHLSLSFAYWEDLTDPQRCGSMMYLGLCINLIRAWLSEAQVGMDEILRLKHEYNKTRPYRHGGKVM